MTEVDRNSDRVIQDEIAEALRAMGHEFRHFSDIPDERAIFLDAAPLILDAYPALTRIGRANALTFLRAGIPSRPLADRLYALLIAEGEDARAYSAQWCAGSALVGFCGRDRDRMLELAADERLGLARRPIILALAKRRDLRAVPLVEGALREPDLRATGLEAVGLMRLHAFAPEIHDSLHDSDVNNRQEARKALKRLQDGKT